MLTLLSYDDIVKSLFSVTYSVFYGVYSYLFTFRKGFLMFQLFHLTPGNGASLQQQLREQIASAILNGNIPLNKALPSSRKMAVQLKVARNTVVIAYEHLLDDGYIIAKERSGYFVNPDILGGKVQIDVANRIDDVPSGSAPSWQHRFKLKPSEQGNIKKPKDWQSFEYPFIYGQVVH